MNVKEAVTKAKEWLADVLREEGPVNIGLEEVEYDEEQRVWKITLGFSRPWNTNRNALTTLTGEPSTRRAYRIIRINDANREIISMKKLSSDDV